nr:DNA/RNA helicase domain-containing protein [uncultured Lichenicoccus sp.]
MNHVPPGEPGSSGAWWSDSVAAFLAATPGDLLRRLAHAATRHHRVNEATQLRAWERQIAVLRSTFLAIPQSRAWRLLLEFEIPRFRRRIDAVLLAPGGVFVLEFKVGATAFTDQDRQQVADYALDLQDFHAGSRRHPILPILIATEAVAGAQMLPFVFDGASDVIEADPASLPRLLHDLARLLPDRPSPLDTPGWESAPYRPVPNVIDAARILFSRQGVAEILSARADATNLTLTTDRIATLMARARAGGRKIILFVTGIPGAGKTLCGLNAAFTTETGIGAAFLTGNPTLVHVLREALVRDAVGHGEKRAPAAHRIKGVIQALPAFRDLHVRTGEVPAERVVV